MTQPYSYFATLMAVVVTLMVLFDTWLGTYTHPIWLVVNYLVVITLLLGLVLLWLERSSEWAQAISWRNTLIVVFAFVIYAGTFIAHENGDSITALNWLLADATAIVALLSLGVRLKGSDKPESE